MTKKDIALRKAALVARRAGLPATKQASLEMRIQDASEKPISGVIPRGDIQGPVKLSFAQQRLWFLDQFEPGNSAYNIPFAVRITGELSIPALEQNLYEIVRRHATLRTTFGFVNGDPVQIISQTCSSVLSVVDLGALSAQEQEVIARKLASEEARRSFDLSSGPLLRTALLRHGDKQHGLLLTVHHIVSDGWSMGVLIRELGDVYRAYTMGDPSPLADLPIQYIDYANWQRQWFQGEALERELSYWKRQLKGIPPVLELASDRPRSGARSFRGGAEPVVISEKLTQDIRLLSQREEKTLYMILLAAFQVLLSRYSGQDDIVIGTPVAGRRWVETEGLIGFFVNTLVMRMKLSSELAFKDLLDQVRETVLESQTHQDVPFEKLVESLQPERSLSHAPLFQVMFVLQNAPEGTVGIEKLRFTPQPFESEVSNFDLTLSIGEEGKALSGVISYSAELFDAPSIRRLARHYQQILESLVTDPSRPISEVRLLGQAELHQLQVEWNDTYQGWREDPAERCLHMLFEQQVERRPEAVAVVFEGGCLSYRELNRRANQVGHYLRGEGVGPEELIGLCVEKSLEMIVGLLGILKAGGAYLPMEPTYPDERLSMMVQDSHLRFLLTQERLVERCSDRAVKRVCLDRDWNAISARSPEDAPTPATPDNAAYVIYTSGSTGRPKGVIVPHRNVLNLFNAIDERLPLRQTDVWTMFHSYSFDFSVWEIWGALLYGGTVVVVPYLMARTPEGFRDLVHEQGVTILSQTPSAFRHFMKAGEVSGPSVESSLRAVIFGGEALEFRSLKGWMERCGDEQPELINMYGITETTVHTTYKRVKNEDLLGSARSVIGGPLANMRLYVLDEHLEPAPVGVIGELFVAGAGMARGYLGREELTAERFIPAGYSQAGERLYRTGDLVRYLRDGNLEYIGRKDHQVKIRGFRIELGEIEVVINQYEKVSESAVVVREDQTRGQRLVAYVAPKGGEEISWAEMRQYLSERLPDYMAPGTYVRMEKLPLTINGKVDRSALPEDAAESGSEEYEEPRTIIEQMIAGIWSEVLGLERVSRKDNFFWVGGHSLVGAQVISRVRERLGVEIGVRSLFEKPALEEFAREVEERLREGRSGRMPVIERRKGKGAERLSYEQEGLWFIDQLQPGGATYNIPTHLRINGELHILALEQGLSEVARRHETLRTTFSISNGEPVQVIGGAELIKLPIVDLSGLQRSERAARAHELAREEGRRPFDLASGPVIRQRIVREDDQQHNILVTMHHILSDAWSMQVFNQEIKAIYERYVKGESSALGELKIQYADYAAWQREWMQGAVLERGLRYWREKLAGAPPALELAMDRARPAAQTSKAAYRSVRLTGDLTRRIKDLSRKEGTTLYMTLLAGFKMLLGRWTNGQDIVVGTPTAGRNLVEIERLIGYFVKTLALRTSLGGDPSLGDVMRRVREVVLEAYAHQDVPFEKLVEELQPERSLGHSPLFQVMFTLQTVEAGVSEKGETDYVEDSEGGGTAKFDLTLALREESEEIRGAIEYNTEIFDGTTVERLARHWVRALAALAADRGRRLSQLELMSEAERHQMVVEWNDTHQGWGEESSVYELFARQAELRPDAIAVVDGWRSVSYGEVERRANEVARSLIIAGVEEEAWVGLRAGRSVEAVIGMLGIIKAGCAYVPMGESNPAERMEAMRREAGVRLVVTYEERLGRLVIEEDGAERGVREEDEGARAGDVVGDVVRRARPQNLAYVIFTSGSTGRPKGVGITHEGLVNLVRWHQWAYGVRPGDRTTQVASLSFDASIWEVWANLSCGASLYIVGEEERMDPSELRSWLISNGINMSFLPTPMAERLMMMRWPEKGELRALLTGGDLLQQHKPDGVSYEVVNNYGPTESAVVATWGSVGSRGAGERLPSIGRPISNTRVYVLDESQGVAPIGVTGELCITGRGLARGYPRMADQTAEKFIADPYVEESGQRMYRTGDLGRYLPDGRIEFLGRVDHQVKVRGFRIELGEIEAVIKGHEKVRESVVVAREDKAGGKRLVAYVAPEKGEEIGWGELRRYLSERLPEYMIPSAYVRMEEMPLTANGKVDRRALPPGDGINVDHSDSFVAPRDDLEKRLANIWESVLGVQPIGVRDNFFEVGGHSILAPRLMAGIEQELGQKLALSTLFQGATIERLAELLRTPSQIERFSPLVSLQSRGSMRPFFCVHPAGGLVSCYTSLAAHIGTDRPFYGLQSKGVGSGRPAFFRIEDMASYYLEALRDAQPEGPYLIGGWSLGGIIAFEMARQLSMQGREVALLALIDSRLPSRSHARLDDSGLLYSFAYDFGIPYNRLTLPEDVLREFSPGERLAYVLSKGKEVDAAPRDMSSTEFHNLFEIFKANVQAMFEYTPGKYAGRVTLLQSQEEIDRRPSYPARLFRKISPLKRRRFRASSLEASVEWEQWATGGVDVLEAPGDHYSMVREPKVRILAEKLRACMDRAEERKRT